MVISTEFHSKPRWLMVWEGSKEDLPKFTSKPRTWNTMVATWVCTLHFSSGTA